MRVRVPPSPQNFNQNRAKFKNSPQKASSINASHVLIFGDCPPYGKMVEEFLVETQKRYQLVNITHKIEQIIKENRIREGLIFIFVPHSTAGIILTEDEEGLKKDWLEVLEKITSGIDFLHNRIDDNADSHILSGLLGQGKALIIEDGKLLRGTWQDIFLVELDGPRKRKVVVKIIKNHGG